jgi:hypothetical protein
MAQPTPAAIRSYRIYFRDAKNVLSQSHEVDLGSDEDARARLVCTVHKGEWIVPQAVV